MSVLAADRAAPSQALPTVAASAGDAASQSAFDPAVGKIAEIVKSTYDYMPTALSGYMAGVAVIATIFWNIVPITVIAPWAAAFAVMCLVRILITRSFWRAKPKTLEQWKIWRLRSNVGTLAAAAMWGATGWLFYGQGAGAQNAALQETGLIVIIYTYCVVGIPVLSIQPRLYLAFAVLCILPLVVRIASVGDLYHYQLGGELSDRKSVV